MLPAVTFSAGRHVTTFGNARAKTKMCILTPAEALKASRHSGSCERRMLPGEDAEKPIVEIQPFDHVVLKSSCVQSYLRAVTCKLKNCCEAV